MVIITAVFCFSLTELKKELVNGSANRRSLIRGSKIMVSYSVPLKANKNHAKTVMHDDEDEATLHAFCNNFRGIQSIRSGQLCCKTLAVFACYNIPRIAQLYIHTDFYVRISPYNARAHLRAINSEHERR